MEESMDLLNAIMNIAEVAQTPLVAYLLYLNYVLWEELTKVNARQNQILWQLLKAANEEPTEEYDL